jgi:hypothetical protein
MQDPSPTRSTKKSLATRGRTIHHALMQGGGGAELGYPLELGEFGELGSTSPGKTDHSILEGRRRHRPGADARFGRS